MVEIKGILTEAVEREASDVHINVGLRPIIRVNTELIETDFPTITDENAKEILILLIGQEKFNTFELKRDFDFSTSITDPDQRFRVNAHYQRDTIAISFRLISDRVPSIEELNLPEKIKEFADLPRGLVLVTGHTGAGKSTTLASTIGLINSKYRKRIITIEDPIEYWLLNDMCMIEQREVGSDCPDFATGLRHILRQDPDIIMVGEMRDLETTSFTLTAAETGHLVFSTLHTPNASQSIERVIDIYPANQQTQARTMLANALQAVISQTLFRRIDQPGMVPST
jgi:twitching motility protein PilT